MTATETVHGPTEEQKDFAAEYLASTRDQLVATVNSLSATQCGFQRAPGEWSVAEVVEHLVIIEGRVQGLIARLPDAEAAEPGRDDSQIDQFVLETVPRRSSRIHAPEAAQPKGQCTVAQALQEFVQKRGETIGLLEGANCLRGRVLSHPVLGSWDGYQWILATAAHTARHLNQIREITNAEAFPKAPAGSQA
jgi:hypothetical protein